MPSAGSYGATIGQLRERITIQSPGTGVDSQGGQAGGATTIATGWARIEPYTTRRPEGLVAGAQASAIWYRVTMWRRLDLAPRMVIVWRSKTLQIEAVFTDPDWQRWTYLDCVSLS